MNFWNEAGWNADDLNVTDNLYIDFNGIIHNCEYQRLAGVLTCRSHPHMTLN
jgi:hypothetical protein